MRPGARFGRLVFLRPERAKYGTFLCDCGNVCVTAYRAVRYGGTQSCGCYSRECAKFRNRKHGMSHTGIYKTWRGILLRCRNAKTPGYVRYGACGIAVCERWASFENFYADMGEKPSPEHSIDRIDNTKGYCPENCRWATKTEQSVNRRTTIKIKLFGGMCCTHVSRIVRVVHNGTIRHRIHNGWPEYAAIYTPPGHKPLEMPEGFVAPIAAMNGQMRDTGVLLEDVP